MNFFLLIIIVIVFSCKKNPEINQPKVVIYEPSISSFVSTDTIMVEFSIFDSDDDIVKARIFIGNNNFTPVSDVTIVNNIRQGERVRIKHPIKERWLPTGTYYLVIIASNKYSSGRGFKEIHIATKAPILAGLLVVVQDNNDFKLYVSDSLYNFSLRKVYYNLVDVAYYPLNNNFVILDKYGNLIFTDTSFNNICSISNLNKPGSIYNGKINYKYPCIYVNNANRFIYGINYGYNISESYATLYEPYFFKWIESELIVFSKNNNSINNFFIELPLLKIQHSTNEKLLDVILFSNNEYLIVTNNNYNSNVNVYLYNKLYNNFRKLNETTYLTYHGSININNEIYLSLDNSLYVYNNSFSSFIKIKDEQLSNVKYFSLKGLVFATHGNELNIYNSFDFAKINTIIFPNEILCYDFIIK
ncbi:MAG: hypothetical protein N3A01_05335 [Bacteroidales bacterium]|nr:hypothetical protein [Bacteroidales bacterium]